MNYWVIALLWFTLGLFIGVPIAGIFISIYGDQDLNNEIAKLRKGRLNLAKAKLDLSKARFELKLMKFIRGAKVNGYVVKIGVKESNK